jgi:biotin transport system substrate-specific component
MKARDLILCALFAALTAIGAFLKIPIPYVPVTMQYFFCAMAGLCLGAKLGALSQAVYVCIGLIGFPVFTEGGGIGYVLKPTFGYLIGFILCAFIIGLLTERMKEMNFLKVFGALMAGIACLYLLGVPYMYAVFNLYLGDAKDIGWVLYVGLVTKVPGNVAMAVAAALIGLKLVPALRRHRLAGWGKAS